MKCFRIFTKIYIKCIESEWTASNFLKILPRRKMSFLVPTREYYVFYCLGMSVKKSSRSVVQNWQIGGVLCLISDLYVFGDFSSLI